MPKNGKPRIPLADKLAKFTGTKDGCWEWIGGKDRQGYGHMCLHNGGKRITILAHRLAYELARGEIPKGIYVLHKCDNPSCVNPDHLFLGTQLDNMRDKVSKQRQLRGERHHSAKLRDEDIPKIRLQYKRGAYQRTIAERFGVSQVLIGLIVRRKIWKHVT